MRNPNFSPLATNHPAAQTMIKPTKTRRQLHQELEQQIQDFLHQGGQVNEVPRGLSGRPDANGPLISIFDGTSQEDRTPLPDVVAAIEARKKPPLTNKPKKLRPRKKVILDDFGQPLRWEWVEE
ncbi:hypothetical protein [Cellvibrio sp. NN19]|uniref:hypothetical protein n=1 Tax=Cellvibrio chitinivorans TaxID=3102792 RepID=UPI002B40C29B|nr:hypothetical protein [Cellvibrio sp. NN19]